MSAICYSLSSGVFLRVVPIGFFSYLFFGGFNKCEVACHDAWKFI